MLEDEDLFKFLDHIVQLSDIYEQDREEYVTALIGEINDQIQPEELVVDANEQPERKDLAKYWLNRFKIFSKLQDSYFLDDSDASCEEEEEEEKEESTNGFTQHGVSPLVEQEDPIHSNIYMTDELWYSVTPEDLAIFTAKWAYACLKDDALKISMDVCCGGGGNTIQMAKHFPHCIGIDNNLQHLYCTYKNAQTYNIDDRVSLLYMDWNDKITTARLAQIYKDKINFIFSSPPWGGPAYLKQSMFDLEKGLSLVGGLTEYLSSLFQFTENVMLFLPRNSDLSQLSKTTKFLLGNDAKCKILYIKTEGHLKGVIAIWGEKLINV